MSPRMDTPQIPCTYVSIFGHPHSEEVFSDVQMELPGFQFVLTAGGSVPGLH